MWQNIILWSVSFALKNQHVLASQLIQQMEMIRLCLSLFSLDIGPTTKKAICLVYVCDLYKYFSFIFRYYISETILNF